MQAIKELSSFFNTVRQSIFHFKPNGFDSRKASAERVDQKSLPQFSQTKTAPSSEGAEMSCLLYGMQCV